MAVWQNARYHGHKRGPGRCRDPSGTVLADVICGTTDWLLLDDQHRHDTTQPVRHRGDTRRHDPAATIDQDVEVVQPAGEDKGTFPQVPAERAQGVRLPPVPVPRHGDGLGAGKAEPNDLAVAAHFGDEGTQLLSARCEARARRAEAQAEAEKAAARESLIGLTQIATAPKLERHEASREQLEERASSAGRSVCR